MLKQLFLFSLLAVGNLMHGAQNDERLGFIEIDIADLALGDLMDIDGAQYYKRSIGLVEKGIEDRKFLISAVSDLEVLKGCMRFGQVLEFNAHKSNIEKLTNVLPTLEENLKECKRKENKEKLCVAVGVLCRQYVTLIFEKKWLNSFVDRLEVKKKDCPIE